MKGKPSFRLERGTHGFVEPRNEAVAGGSSRPRAAAPGRGEPGTEQPHGLHSTGVLPPCFQPLGLPDLPSREEKGAAGSRALCKVSSIFKPSSMVRSRAGRGAAPPACRHSPDTRRSATAAPGYVASPNPLPAFSPPSQGLGVLSAQSCRRGFGRLPWAAPVGRPRGWRGGQPHAFSHRPGVAQPRSPAAPRSPRFGAANRGEPPSPGRLRRETRRPAGKRPSDCCQDTFPGADTSLPDPHPLPSPLHPTRKKFPPRSPARPPAAAAPPRLEGPERCPAAGGTNGRPRPLPGYV